MSFHMASLRGGSRFGNNPELSDDDLRRLAPSIFAQEPHKSRSNRYVYIPTSAILDGMRKEGFTPVKAIQGKTRIAGKAEYTKHMIRFRHSDYIGTEKVGGVVPEVILVNSHDGTSCYHLMSGLFRIACLNGMVRCESVTADVKVKHSGNVIDEVIDGAFTVIEDSRIGVDEARAWDGVRLLPNERSALADAARVLRFGDSDGNVETPIRSEQLLHARRAADYGDSLWNTHNVLQENMIRGGLSAMGRDSNNRPRRITSKEVRNIDGDVKLNRALWMLSAKMAELKGVSI